MVGVNLSGSVLSSLQCLASVQSQFAIYQKQMSTGERVNGPADDPVAWAAATRATAQETLMNAAGNGLSQAASITAVASSALANVLSVLNKMKTDVASAQQSPNNVAAAETDIAAQQQTLISAITTASADNVNLLDGSAPNPSFVTSYARSSTGALLFSSTSVSTDDTILTLPATAGGLLGAATAAGSASGAAGTADGAGGAYAATSLLGFAVSSDTSASDYDTLLSSLDAAVTHVTSGAAGVGAVQSAVQNEKTYAATLASDLDDDATSLTAADMNTASARLQALQTQQQLAIQALSIANQNSALVLKLFGL